MRFVIVACFLALLAGESATAQMVGQNPLFPLETGRVWRYDTKGPQIFARVDGGALFAGSQVSAIQTDAASQSWTNYWSVAQDGSVTLHGWVQEPTGLAVAYDPPLIWLPPAISEMTSWSSQASMADPTTLEPRGRIEVRAMWLGTTSTPAWNAIETVRYEIVTRDEDGQVVLSANPLGPWLGGEVGISSFSNPLGAPKAAEPLVMEQGFIETIGLAQFEICCPEDTAVLDESAVGVAAPDSWSGLKGNWADGP